MKRKYGISGELPKDIGKTYVCLECKQFKGFTNYINNKGKRINLYAYGHSKVLVEDDNMKLYCGKRCDKVDAKKRHNNMQEYSSFIEMDDESKRKLTELRVKKRDAKENEKILKIIFVQIQNCVVLIYLGYCFNFMTLCTPYVQYVLIS